jgi:GAF domain-containing protein
VPSDPRIREAIDHVSQALGTTRHAIDALSLLTRGAVDAIPGADYASISVLTRRGLLETVAPTDELINSADQIQYDLQQGPCYEVVTDASFLVSEDVERDGRWPDYGRQAANLGLATQMAVLISSNGARASLNLYATRPHAFDAEAIEIAELFASHASVIVAAAWTIETLNNAIDTRTVIGEAIGIVMERYQIDRERAFQFLLRVSSHSNVKLREVADGIVTGLDSRTHLAGDHATGQGKRSL